MNITKKMSLLGVALLAATSLYGGSKFRFANPGKVPLPLTISWSPVNTGIVKSKNVIIAQGSGLVIDEADACCLNCVTTNYNDKDETLYESWRTCDKNPIPSGECLTNLNAEILLISGPCADVWLALAERIYNTEALMKWYAGIYPWMKALLKPYVQLGYGDKAAWGNLPNMNNYFAETAKFQQIWEASDCGYPHYTAIYQNGVSDAALAEIRRHYKDKTMPLKLKWEAQIATPEELAAMPTPAPQQAPIATPEMAPEPAPITAPEVAPEAAEAATAIIPAAPAAYSSDTDKQKAAAKKKQQANKRRRQQAAKRKRQQAAKKKQRLRNQRAR